MPGALPGAAHAADAPRPSVLRGKCGEFDVHAESSGCLRPSRMRVTRASARPPQVASMGDNRLALEWPRRESLEL
jgi:hypothetical protein